MTRWARAWSFHRFGSSAWRFSSASRFCDLSTSKMPPQQSDRLPDRIDVALRFRAHGFDRRDSNMDVM
jgi:hypothetical protein